MVEIGVMIRFWIRARVIFTFDVRFWASINVSLRDSIRLGF